MRRLRILVAGALVGASVTAWAGTAYAARGSDFCDTANETYDDIADFNPLDSAGSDGFEDQIDATIDAYEELEDSAPKKLRKPFRVNRKYIELFQDGDIDFSDPDDIADLTERTAKVVRANTKIYKYLANECGLDLPDLSAPDLSVPDVSLPDVSLPDVSIPEFDDN